MHLRSLALKGFKSFPERTRLDFGPGVSVVVGPNGSGKSNVTDAVLWAMGEQSPLTVRGSSMQDVIFGGGRGVKARDAAEVEIVLDNSDGTVSLPLSEISILRRLDRSGEGEYRLNGARCRLADVLEVLSDTGLGKESHSVISQGRVEAIVMSRPRERRLLIEEAAGLGKHRRRRRRAQLKLTRTEENLSRALDVEREARTRLRPLKRQAEAAELHARLEHQSLEARLALGLDAARSRAERLVEAEQAARQVRAALTETEARLQEVVAQRGVAERALAERSERREALSRRVYGARTALERLSMRAEQVGSTRQTLAERMRRVEAETEALSAAVNEGSPSEQAPGGRLAELEQALADLEREQEQQLERELEQLAKECERAARRTVEAEEQAQRARLERAGADEAADAARAHMRALEKDAQEARRQAAQIGAELAAANQFLRSHSHPLAGRRQRSDGSQVRALSELLRVEEGCELALAAALGGRLEAALVADLAAAGELLDGAGPDGGTVLISQQSGGAAASEAPAGDDAGSPPGPGAAGGPPGPGARPILQALSGPPEALALAARLLAETWLVERIEDVSADFGGVAVTRSGRVWLAALGEVRQVAGGGAERVLTKRNERDALIAATEHAAQAEHSAQQAVQAALKAVEEADGLRDVAEASLRQLDRALSEAREQERAAKWVVEQRRKAPNEGPLAVRRAELAGELAAERRQAERLQRERVEREQRLQLLNAQLVADRALLPAAERLAGALAGASEAVGAHLREAEALLAEDRREGEQMAGQLRECAQQEAEIQSALRAQGEAVTSAEVAAQRLRDQAEEAELELKGVSQLLEIEPPSLEASQPLEAQERSELEARLMRLTRRREQLGPVNPLAEDEYAEAVAHVEELESRRADLETALRELRTVIRDTDRQIEETFEQTFAAAARNFEELVGDVFPGGSGRLRLVAADGKGQDGEGEGAREAERSAETGEGPEVAAEAAADAEAGAEAEDEESGAEDLLGVEIEITPAGKSRTRLSLLSGGEKSMTALAFMFAVFLARPCPFYILDEVEAALDDLNLSRFLTLLRRYADRSQFIVITHQKRTMEAADWLYGVSMGGDGVSKVISRKLPPAASERAASERAEVESHRGEAEREQEREETEPQPEREPAAA